MTGIGRIIHKNAKCVDISRKPNHTRTYHYSLHYEMNMDIQNLMRIINADDRFEKNTIMNT